MLRTLVLGAVLLVPGLSMAAQAPKAPVHIVMGEDDVIQGTNTGPDGDDITAKPRPTHASTIRVRTSFSDKVLNSVSEL